MGFGHSSHIHTTRVLRLTQDLPIVIEIVDAEERICSLGSRINRSSVPMVPIDGAGKAIAWDQSASHLRLAAPRSSRASGSVSTLPLIQHQQQLRQPHLVSEEAEQDGRSGPRPIVAV